MSTSTNILDIKNIEVTYDNVILALHDVSLKVPKGKVVALLGANGAGKSTTLKAVSTMLASERGKVTKGTIEYDGNSIEKQNPSQMVGLGMVQVLEGRRCFGHLTVEENIIAGAYSRKLSKGDINQELEKIYTYFIRLKERRKSQAAFTSGGEQQMLAIARGMMGLPKLLMVDEPFLGLSPMVVKDLIKQGKKIAGYGAAAKGMTILKCSNIGNKLKYFVDDSPAKQGFYSPVDHIPIISRKKAQTKLPDYFIILAPNYSDIIIKKEKNIKKKDLVIITAGLPFGKAGMTNMIRLYKVGT